MCLQLHSTGFRDDTGRLHQCYCMILNHSFNLVRRPSAFVRNVRDCVHVSMNTEVFLSVNTMCVCMYICTHTFDVRVSFYAGLADRFQVVVADGVPYSIEAATYFLGPCL